MSDSLQGKVYCMSDGLVSVLGMATNMHIWVRNRRRLNLRFWSDPALLMHWRILSVVWGRSLQELDTLWRTSSLAFMVDKGALGRLFLENKKWIDRVYYINLEDKAFTKSINRNKSMVHREHRDKWICVYPVPWQMNLDKKRNWDFLFFRAHLWSMKLHFSTPVMRSLSGKWGRVSWVCGILHLFSGRMLRQEYVRELKASGQDIKAMFIELQLPQ